MRLEFNPSVAKDISAAAAWYREVGEQLERDYLLDLKAAFSMIAETPTRFHFDPTGWRRFNLKRFPYHVLFKEKGELVRVMAVRHDRQSPDYGTHRK